MGRRTIVIHEPGIAVFIEFVSKCGELEIASDQDVPVHYWHKIDDNTLTLLFAEPPGAQVSLEIEFTGELLELRSRRPIPFWEFPDILDPRRHPSFEFSVKEALKEVRKTTKHINVWRDEEAKKGPFVQEKLLFNYMDTADGAKVNDMAKKNCKPRLEARKGTVDPPFSTDEQTVVNMGTFSTFLLSSFEHYFPSQTAIRFDLELVESMFDRFAAGELRLLKEKDYRPEHTKEHRLACRPDSVYQFFFAEFADMCIKKEVDKDAWTALLPGLVYSNAVFCSHYRTEKGSGKLCYPQVVNLKDPDKELRKEEDAASMRKEFVNRHGSDLRAEWQRLVKENIDFDCKDDPLPVPPVA